MSSGIPFLLADVNKTFWFPEQASTFAREVDWLYDAILYISLFFFIIIVAVMVLFVIWYRKRPGYQGSSLALHNNALEITWTVIPSIIAVWIFARGASGYLDMMQPPPDTLDINVTARQWTWTFQYPNGAISDQLHIPNQRAVKLVMRSDDVLHALFVPAFRCKTDIVPGRVNIMWFEAIKEGTYDLFCAEYCGEKHSEMLAKVTVHGTGGGGQSYEQWVTEAAKPPTEPAAWGKWLYDRVGCKGCHSLEKDKIAVGPSLAYSFGSKQKMVSGEEATVDEQYIRESILNPQAKKRAGFERASLMPTFQGKLKEDEISALTTFIKSIKDGYNPTEAKKQ